MKIKYTHNSRFNEIFRGEPVSLPTGYVGNVPDAVGEMLVKRGMAVEEMPVAAEVPRQAPPRPADPPKPDSRMTGAFTRKDEKKDEDDD